MAAGERLPPILSGDTNEIVGQLNLIIEILETRLQVLETAAGREPYDVQDLTRKTTINPTTATTADVAHAFGTLVSDLKESGRLV